MEEYQFPTSWCFLQCCIYLGISSLPSKVTLASTLLRALREHLLLPAAVPVLLDMDGSDLLQELSLLRYGTQGRKITSTVLKLLTCHQEFIDHTQKLIFIQKPRFCAVNSIFFRAIRLLSTMSEL